MSPFVVGSTSSILIQLIDCGMYLAYLATFSYLADSYTLYASSALSCVKFLLFHAHYWKAYWNESFSLRAQSFIRNLLGCVAPLYTNQLYHNLGIAGGGSLVAGIGEFFHCSDSSRRLLIPASWHSYFIGGLTLLAVSLWRTTPSSKQVCARPESKTG